MIINSEENIRIDILFCLEYIKSTCEFDDTYECTRITEVYPCIEGFLYWWAPVKKSARIYDVYKKGY